LNPIRSILTKSITVFFVLILLLITKSAYAQLCSSPALVSMSVATQNLRCYGDNTGSISVSITGGSTPSYTYSLYSVVLDPIIINNYPLNNYTFSNLPADNNYFLVIQVPIGGGAFAFCSQSIALTQPPPLAISSASITDVSCNGGNDGAIDATVTGGPTLPYTYAWSNGATTEDISGLTAGNYTLTITDGNGCSTSKTFTIAEPAALTITSTVTNVSCIGGSDGAIDITPSGGTAPYTFSWSNGAITEDLSGLIAGSYTVTITDSKNCKKVFSFTITQPAAAITAAAPTITNISCNGTNTGGIDITPTGGTAPYTFAWSNGTTTEDLTNVAAGSYSVTITDSKGCTKALGPYTITQAPVIALSGAPTITNVTCNGAATGAIAITVTGGTAPYTYSWSNATTAQNLANATAGSYTVNVTDNKGCTKALGPFTITEPAPITATSVITNASCNGTSDGSVIITPAGGTAPYTYTWSNGATSKDLTNVIAGSYTLTIKDNKGCTSTVGPFAVTQPVPIASTGTITNVTCNGGNTGAVSLTNPTGGTAPYTYLWSNAATSQNISALIAGVYSVTITDSKGCKNNLSFTITEPAAITAAAPTITNISCNGTNTGGIDITPTGGTAPYTFAWSNGTTTEDLTNVAAGSYSVTITDSKGCTKALGPYTITQAPVIALSGAPTITNVTCNGAATGAIAITVTGGTAPYTYSWSNATTAQNLANATAGSYTVNVTDSKGCTKALGPFTITEPAPITATSVITNASCNGSATGGINITPKGGTGPYTYLWSNGATSQNLVNVSAGSYSVTITDSKSCSKILGPFAITQPIAIVSTGTITNVTCNAGNTGAISLTNPTGGTGPYTYLWSNAATSQNISALIAGVYSVTITDSKGCKNTLNFTITEPTAIASTGAVTNVICNGTATGAINISNPTGGTGPYSFLWSNGITTQNIVNLAAGNYSVVITDAKGCKLNLPFTVTEPSAINTTATTIDANCNGTATGSVNLSNPTGGVAPFTYAWSNGATSQNNINIIAGSYTVAITDSKGCTKNLGPFVISEPAAISATGTTTTPSCNGSASGAITLALPTGGTAPYTYNWSNGAITQNISSVIAGTYSVTITDSKGCASPAPISFTINPGAAITGTATATPTGVCSGDPVTVNAALDPAYTPAANAYSFNNGVSFQAASSFAIASITGDTVVSVVLKDATGCLTNAIPVSITTNKINASLSQTQAISCFGGSNGELTVTVTGSSAGFTYSINGFAPQSSNVFSNLSKGIYTVVIDNGTSCKSSYTATLTEPALLTIGIKSTTDVNPCIALNNGSLSVTTNGGNGGNSFTINPSGTSQTDSLFSNLTAATYTITVTDSKGCTANTNATINQPASISITSSITAVNCVDPLSGAIDVTVSGGIAPYTYLWSDGSTNQDLMNIAAGSYKIIVTDSKNCKDSSTIILNNAPTITGTASASPSVVCFGQSTTVTATIDPAYTPAANAYSFDGGLTFQASSSFSISSISSDTAVNVILKDINSCVSNPIVVNITTSKINASVSISKPISCSGGSDGELTVNVIGSAAGYTYSINGGAFQTSNVFSNLSNGSYVIVIDDGTACKSSYTTSITDPLPMTIAIKNIIDVSPCAGGNNASIQVTTTGGNSGKTFTITPSGSSQTDSLFSNLFAGSYTITVTDSKGCTANTSATVIQPSGVDTSLIIPIIVDNVCAGRNEGSVKLTNVTGGIGPYTYTLNGVTNSTSSFNLLLAGKYTMVITDAKGCTYNYVFTIHEPLPVLYATIITPSSCTSADGSIEIFNVTGGTPPYKYSINDGATYVNTLIFNNLPSGTYPVRVIDNNGCSTAYSVVLPTKTAPVPYIKIQEPSCHGNSDGFIVVDSVSGGVPLFQYNFNGVNVGSTTVYSSLATGSYALSITDQACSYNIDSFYVYNKTTGKYDTLSALKINVPEPSDISASSFSENADRYENSGVAGIYNITGGTPGYKWSSDNVSFAPVTSDTVLLTNQHKGAHTIYLVDKNGCKASIEITILVQFFIPNLITPNNDGKNDRFEIMALPIGCELKIVNRWGNQVYLNSNYDNTWSADDDSDGVYYYELILPNGDRHKGWVEVIR